MSEIDVKERNQNLREWAKCLLARIDKNLVDTYMYMEPDQQKAQHDELIRTFEQKKSDVTMTLFMLATTDNNYIGAPCIFDTYVSSAYGYMSGTMIHGAMMFRDSDNELSTHS